MANAGTHAEDIAGKIAASACLSDFVFLRPVRCEKNVQKELCDLLLELDQEAVCIQIKAQETEYRRSGEAELRWARKQLTKASSQASGAIRVLKYGLSPVEAYNPRRGKVAFARGELRPIHGIVLLDYEGGPLFVQHDVPTRVHSNIPIHYLSYMDFIGLTKCLGTLPDLIQYLSERARLPSWSAPLIGTERDAYAYYLMHEQQFLPTIDRGAFEGEWERLNGTHSAKYARKLEEDRFAEIVNHIIDEVHNIDPKFEAQLPEELRGRVPVPDKSNYVKIATELNKLPKIVRREVGKKLLAKAKLSAETKKPRWFARYEPGGRIAFLFLVSSLSREDRIRVLNNLLMALLFRIKLSCGIGVAMTDATVQEAGFEFLWVADVKNFDQVTQDMSAKLFSNQKHERYFDFPDDANRIVIPPGLMGRDDGQ